MMHARPASGDSLIFGALLALLLWLPLPWGSNSPWAKSLLIGVSASLLTLWLLGAAAGAIRPAAGRMPKAPMLWWLAWLSWLGASLMPWPPELLALWSPGALSLVEQSRATGIDLMYRPAILPAATADALLLSAGYASLYLLVILTCLGQPERARSVLTVLVISGLVQALYGAVMVLSGVEWGFLEAKQSYRRVATGTFVNRNHLAGYLELCGAAALGLILSDLGRGRVRRGWREHLLGLIDTLFSRKVRVRLALIIMAIALVMTRSRMGNIAFFAALGICGLGYILLRHREQAFAAFVLFSSVILIDLLIVTRWYGLDQLVERIEQTDFETNGRARLLEALPPVIDTYWQTGSGLGSFWAAYAPHHPGEHNEFFLHAHNDYLQFLIETGAPGAALLAIFVAAHMLHAVRVLIGRRRRLPAAISFAGLMATTALMLHSFTDFNLQIPANAATLLVLLALTAGIPARSARRHRSVGGELDKGLH